jgi:hypothetical protein
MAGEKYKAGGAKSRRLVTTSTTVRGAEKAL